MTQHEYIEILFGDCGFDRQQRKAWLRVEFKCEFVDEITAHQRHLVIEALKAIKEQQKP